MFELSGNMFDFLCQDWRCFFIGHRMKESQGYPFIEGNYVTAICKQCGWCYRKEI